MWQQDPGQEGGMCLTLQATGSGVLKHVCSSPKAFTKQKVDSDLDAQPHTLGELTTPPKARGTVPQLGVKLKQPEKD